MFKNYKTGLILIILSSVAQFTQAAEGPPLRILSGFNLNGDGKAYSRLVADQLANRSGHGSHTWSAEGASATISFQNSSSTAHSNSILCGCDTVRMVRATVVYSLNGSEVRQASRMLSCPALPTRPQVNQ